MITNFERQVRQAAGESALVVVLVAMLFFFIGLVALEANASVEITGPLMTMSDSVKGLSDRITKEVGKQMPAIAITTRH